ncbi:hypothetical protein [Bradyrhizobium sp. ORS 111]|uniref:hypothetical protein n=1 Tax=Bradyrhizobium sp. ORS 111 TaxID=1685958 RepID=UPI00388E81A8
MLRLDFVAGAKQFRHEHSFVTRPAALTTFAHEVEPFFAEGMRACDAAHARPSLAAAGSVI